MTIKKFTGKTEEDAKAKASAELGSNCVIMNVRIIKPKGLFRIFKSNTFEVTAAIEDENQKQEGLQQMGRINLAADEKIDVSTLLEKAEREAKSYHKEEPVTDTNVLEERLDSLQTLLERKLSVEKEEQPNTISEKQEEKSLYTDESLKYIKMIYRTLLDGEMNEVYINQLVGELDKIIQKSTSIDYLLSSVYQKMILKLGQAKTIDLSGPKPKVIFFIGPTGVGKTTTIAKVASKMRVENNKKIALLTADTYRIAAAEQLRTYANILDTPLTILYSKEELNQVITKFKDCDAILIDTAGFSHKNEKQRQDIKELIACLDSKYQKEVFLVLSATTKYRDLIEIVDSYKEIAAYKLLFTKLDETDRYGNIYNIKMYTGAELSYTTNGQNVPDDIELCDTQKLVKFLLGGK